MITTNEGIRFPDGSIQVEAASPAAGALHSLDAADGNPVDAVFVAAGGNVGIGIDPTQRTPQEELTLAPSFNLATEIPTPNVVTASPIGGTLPPGDYTFWVSASDGTGWTKASDPYLRTLPSTNGGLRITWGPVLGATKYRLYRVVNSVPTEYKYVETPTNTYDYSDDGPFTPDAPPYSSPPAQSTAYINKLSASGPSWLLGGNLGIGTSTPVVPLHIKGPRGTIYLDGSPGSQVYYLNNGTPEWCLGTQTGQPTQDLMLFNYRTLSIAFVVNRDTNWITVVAGLSAPGFTSSSSKRWKKNIQTISGALGIVKRLRGISYSQKDDDKRNIGLIAEEVGEVIPEIVTFEENGTDAQGLDYSRLVAVLIEAAKEQQEQIEELKAAVRSLLAWKQETRDTRVAERA